MPKLRVVHLDRRKAASIFLDQYRQDTYSQSGEDGVIQKIFEIIEPRNKWCVEFGAWDGLHLSNTCKLIKEDG